MSAPGNPLETYDVPSRRRWTVLSSTCPTGNPGGAALAGARASAIAIRSQRSRYDKGSDGGFPKGTHPRTVQYISSQQSRPAYHTGKAGRGMQRAKWLSPTGHPPRGRKLR